MREDLARVVGCACDSLDHCTCGAAYLARRGREPVARSLLHVTNGESAGNTLRRTALCGAVLSWQDVREGPVPASSRASLRTARARFLAACGWGSARAIGAELERRDSQLLSALQEGIHVVFWFEHDLYDQLQLLDALSLVADSGVAVGSLELIVVDSFPGRPAFRGLGELEADELETLWASRAPATPSLVATAAEVRDAVRAPTPIALAEASGRPLDDLPFVPAALRRLLAELPGARDGLSGTERRALRAIAEVAATPFAAFAAAQDAEEASFLGDAWFFRALSHLGSGLTPRRARVR